MSYTNNDSFLTSGATIVVVGNGMVGHRLCSELRQRRAAEDLKIIVFGEEPRQAYDRVHLSAYFDETPEGEEAKDPGEALLLAPEGWYEEQGITLCLGQRIAEVDTENKRVITAAGDSIGYDALVLATGSSAFVPPIPGMFKDEDSAASPHAPLGDQSKGMFVYRTLEDLDLMSAHAEKASRCAVIGGGLLGLEAARAVQGCGLEAHVVELAPRLMPRQLDETAGRLLARTFSKMDVHLHLGRATAEVCRDADGMVSGLRFDGEEEAEPFDMLVVAAGIRPRDELARQAGIEVGPRGGIVVDDLMRTSAPGVFAVGEVALHEGMIYGLVAPGYEMATVLAAHLSGETEETFTGADLSAKLKVLGLEVASFGDPFADEKDLNAQVIAMQDFVEGHYKKVILDPTGERVLGGILVGDASAYGTLCHYARSGEKAPASLKSLLGLGGGDAAEIELPDSAQICSCVNVCKGDIAGAVASGEACSVADIKSCTGAGTGCGGCVPQISDLVDAGLLAMGMSTRKRLCEHFDLTRQEMCDVVKVTGISTFEELLAKHGEGGLGCEVCKPTAASIFASLQGEMILAKHATLQDTNDRFLANIQRRGLYSVIPRIPGGEITPDKLIVLGEVAKKYGLYTKITGGQRVDLFGAKLNQLPEIWEELVEAGFESGHAYAKGLRTVKSCVGSTWCRFGVDDSVGLAIRLEERYRGIRSPHKLKSAVSGCVRECAEAQSKDFGIIATDNGWNLYVCGNGGAKPRHADLLATDLDEETLVRYIDRFLMYYILTADKLTRTSVWVTKIDGGIEHVRDVVVNDSLGLGAELEERMQALVDSYACEWAEVVKSPERRASFRHFANSDGDDEYVIYVDQRDQRRVADWDELPKRRLPVLSGDAANDVEEPEGTEWISAGQAAEFPQNGGMSVKHGDIQLAVYRFEATGEWYATQNMCPHKQDMVLARGLLGDKAGEPKVVCPMHKKNFSLETGESLGDDDLRIMTFPVKLEDGEVFVRVPPAATLAEDLCPSRSACHLDAAE